jgi:hypothetical protein
MSLQPTKKDAGRRASVPRLASFAAQTLGTGCNPRVHRGFGPPRRPVETPNGDRDGARDTRLGSTFRRPVLFRIQGADGRTGTGRPADAGGDRHGR